MDVERKTQRARRQERQGLARVALVGYTNAGKSTLMRALTGSEVLVADKLFATLDTTVRALHPESVPRVLVSDTVGFIKNLPHGLVASFKSTLDEALEASLLLHVVDASDPGFERQLEVTEEVLDEIGAQDVPRLLRLQQDRPRRRRGGASRTRSGAARAVPRVHRDERAPRGRRREAARGDRRVLPARPGRGRALPALVGAASCAARSSPAARCWRSAPTSEGAFFRVRGEPEAVKRLREQVGPAPKGKPGRTA